MSERSKSTGKRIIDPNDGAQDGSVGGSDSASGGPRALTSHLAKATELFGRGAYLEAREAFTAALAENADDLEAIVGLGASYLAQAQYDGAEREFRKAVRIAPNSGEVHYQLALTLFRRGLYSAAAPELRRAVELEPDYAPAFVLLGETLNHTGEIEAAIEALENAIRLQPAGKAFYALGIAYDRKGQHDRAAEMYRRSREFGGR